MSTILSRLRRAFAGAIILAVVTTGLDLLLESISQANMVRNCEDTLFVLIGSGPELAQLKMLARQKGLDFSGARPRGFKDIFWYHVFVPIYHALPETLRQVAFHSLPGSHRRAWPKPGPRPRPPAKSILTPNP